MKRLDETPRRGHRDPHGQEEDILDENAMDNIITSLFLRHQHLRATLEAFQTGQHTDVAGLIEDKEVLMQQFQELRMELEAREAAATGELGTLREALKTQEDATRQSEAQLAEATSRLQLSQQETLKLETNLQGCEVEIAELKEAVLDQTARYDAERGRGQQDLKEMESEVEDARSSISKLRKPYHSLQMEHLIHRTTLELGSAREDLLQATKANHDQEHLARSRHAELEEFKSQHAELGRALDAANKQLAAIQDSKAQLEVMFSDLADDVDAQASAKRELEKVKQALELKLKEQQRDFDRDEKVYKENAEELTAELKEKERAMAELQVSHTQSAQANSREIRELKQQRSQQQLEQEELQAQFSSAATKQVVL